MSSAGDWHGGCMAVAEFSQRGCILPQRLPFIMELVCKALEFDDSSKATAVNVRDAACYICWAFARGFGKDTLNYDILKTLAFKLVSTALFDRSVNVRRAAGAAFQVNFIQRFSQGYCSYNFRKMLVEIYFQRKLINFLKELFYQQ